MNETQKINKKRELHNKDLYALYHDSIERETINPEFIAIDRGLNLGFNRDNDNRETQLLNQLMQGNKIILGGVC